MTFRRRGLGDGTIYCLVIGSIILICLVAAYFLESASCDVKARSFASHEFTLLGGCMVLHNGRWLPIENIRGFDDKG